MENLSPEIQALISTIVYLDCRMEAVLQLLGERGITLEPKEVHAAAHKIHAIQGEVKRYQISRRIQDPNFDIV
jgi:deoxyadenosine/deoxycytidine kinase